MTSGRKLPPLTLRPGRPTKPRVREFCVRGGGQLSQQLPRLGLAFFPHPTPSDRQTTTTP
jgi:hypothetical protein